VTRDRRLLFALFLNVAIVGLQVVFGLLGHSLGLLADAGHNLTDLAAVALALYAVHLVRRGPTAKRSFGYHRGTILSAQANAASILAITALVVYEAIRRLIHPVAVHGLTVLLVAAAATVLNAVAALVLRDRSEDLNMRSTLLHMWADAAASSGVAVAGAVIYATKGYFWLDPGVSLGIGVMIVFQAIKLLKATTDVLLESTPAGVDPEAVSRQMSSVSGVEEVHDLHVWSLSSDVRALSAHVVLSGHPSLEEAQAVGTKIKASVSAPFRIAHATLELECENCVDDGSWCAIETTTLSLKD
jgi:cobalt-zinc-cadmium efflux system protein